MPSSSKGIAALFLVFAINITLIEQAHSQPGSYENSWRQVNSPQTMPKTTGDLRIKPHPRLYVNAESLELLKEKLRSEVYAGDIESIKKNKHPTIQAFKFLLWGDRVAGDSAKDALLAGKIKKLPGFEEGIRYIQLAVMYDWLFPLLSETDKTKIRARIKNIVKSLDRERAKKGVLYYYNDHWARTLAFQTILALAVSGEESWADNFLLNVYQKPQEYFSPYTGGAIDVLNTIALDSGGGDQSGNHSAPGTGYEAMFLFGANFFFRAWESATGEKISERTSYFERFPFYLTQAYLHVSKFGQFAKQALEYGTGLGSADSRGLAKWLLDQEGRAKYGLMFRLIFGDLTEVQARSPGELGLPLVSYLRGADLVVSRTGWASSDTAVFMTARFLDTSRYEPFSGLVYIYKNGEPLLVRGRTGKEGNRYTNTSGMWIWEAPDAFRRGQGSSYWQSLISNGKKNRKIKRASSAIPVLNKQSVGYFPNTLERLEEKDGGMAASVRYEKLLTTDNVSLAFREINHSGNIVYLEDRVDAGPNVRVAWSVRLNEEPVISGNIIETSKLIIRLQSEPESKIYWSGGVGKELIGPTGKWHGNKKHGYVAGYGRDKKKVRRLGLGYVFAEPTTPHKKYSFQTTIEIK